MNDLYQECLDKVAFSEYCEKRYQEIVNSMKDSTDPNVMYFRENMDAKYLLRQFQDEWNQLKIELELDWMYDDLIEKNLMGGLLDNPNSWS